MCKHSWACANECMLCIEQSHALNMATTSNEQIFICFLFCSATVLLFSHFFSLFMSIFLFALFLNAALLFFLLIYRHRSNSEYCLISTALINIYIYVYKFDEAERREGEEEDIFCLAKLGWRCCKCRRFSFSLSFFVYVCDFGICLGCPSTHFEIRIFRISRA